MTRIKSTRRTVLAASLLLVLSGCGMMGEQRSASGGGTSESVTLSGSNEVPPVQTAASGNGTVRVAPDGAVDVRVTVTGMTPTAAHIHQGAAGANGPVIVPLTKQGDATFVAAPGAKMTEEQLKAYRAGNTYLNVHSAKHQGGEVRAQLRGR